MPDDRRVSAERPVREGTFLQLTGLALAGSVRGLIALVILGLIGKWALRAPVAPVIPPGADQNTVKTILDNFEPFTMLFDSVVVKVLVSGDQGLVTLSVIYRLESR